MHDAPTPLETEARLPTLEEMEKSLIAAALDNSETRAEFATEKTREI